VTEATRAKKLSRIRRRLFLDRRGAVYVEFIGSFFPIFMTFWCLLQSAGLYSAKLVVRNSAYLGARAAAVVIPDDPKRYGGAAVGSSSGKRKTAINSAVKQGLAANRSIMPVVMINTNGGGGVAKSSFGREDVVVVTVTALYKCRLPLADKIVCGLGGTAPLIAQASMVVNGADYEYP
jgi:hypothetical protein